VFGNLGRYVQSSQLRHYCATSVNSCATSVLHMCFYCATTVPPQYHVRATTVLLLGHLVPPSPCVTSVLPPCTTLCVLPLSLPVPIEPPCSTSVLPLCHNVHPLCDPVPPLCHLAFYFCATLLPQLATTEPPCFIPVLPPCVPLLCYHCAKTCNHCVTLFPSASVLPLCHASPSTSVLPLCHYLQPL